ncbi:MAG: MaoC family dehydratase [Chloroflexota bacterium]
MPPDEMALEELRRHIGDEAGPIVFTIDRTLVNDYVLAVGDPNPLWLDEAYAAQTGHGTPLAPPYLLCALRTIAVPDPTPGSAPLPLPRVPPPRPRVLDGGEEWHFYQPIKLGDTITSRTRLADLYEREGKVGKMLFFIFESTFTNQQAELVATSTYTMINY